MVSGAQVISFRGEIKLTFEPRLDQSINSRTSRTFSDRTPLPPLLVLLPCFTDYSMIGFTSKPTTTFQKVLYWLSSLFCAAHTLYKNIIYQEYRGRNLRNVKNSWVFEDNVTVCVKLYKYNTSGAVWTHIHVSKPYGISAVLLSHVCDATTYTNSASVVVYVVVSIRIHCPWSLAPKLL